MDHSIGSCSGRYSTFRSLSHEPLEPRQGEPIQTNKAEWAQISTNGPLMVPNDGLASPWFGPKSLYDLFVKEPASTSEGCQVPLLPHPLPHVEELLPGKVHRVHPVDPPFVVLQYCIQHITYHGACIVSIAYILYSGYHI